MTKALRLVIVTMGLLVLLLPQAGQAVLAAGTWSLTGSMNSARGHHTATLLPNGKVLVAGGISGFAVKSAELYDPTAGTWSPTGSMSFARDAHTATLLQSGKVLVAGGFDELGNAQPSAELYTPRTGTWSLTGSMNVFRADHTATLLPNGQVLVAGGEDNLDRALASAELYNPETDKWSLTGSMHFARINHTATLLPNGQVLVAGGEDSLFPEHDLASAELYNPKTKTWSLTGSMNSPRINHTATLLPNGKVLVAGGFFPFGNAQPSAELYDPTTGKWSVSGSMNTARAFHTATLLNTGQVLVAGGTNNCATGCVGISSAELYDPTTGTWSVTASMNNARFGHTATLLGSGKVLVAGGISVVGFGSLRSAELFVLT